MGGGFSQIPGCPFPLQKPTPTAKSKTILLVASGVLRASANEVCWPAQRAMEKILAAELELDVSVCGTKADGKEF